jgi:hypothetical protein
VVDILRRAPASSPPRREQRALIDGTRRSYKLGGDEVHHALAQIAERRVGRADAEWKHGDERRVGVRRVSGTAREDQRAECNSHDARRGCDRPNGTSITRRARRHDRSAGELARDRVQCGDEVARALWPRVRILLDAAHHERIECGWEIAAATAQGRWFLTDMCCDESLCRRLGVERVATSNQLVRHHAPRVEVNAMIDGVACRLLGGHVGRRA